MAKNTIKRKIADKLSQDTKDRIKQVLGKPVEPKEWRGLSNKERRNLIEGQLEPDRKRQLSKTISGNITYEKPLALKSQVRDGYYGQLLESGLYTFENPMTAVNPYGLTPLCALVLFSTKKPCRSAFLVKGDGENTDVSGEIPATTSHRLPVFGLYPGRENIVTIMLKDEFGKVIAEKEIKLKTKALPEVLDNIVSVRKKGAVSAYNLFFIMGGGEVMPFAFDRDGQVRYYLNRMPKGYGIFLMTNGHILFPEKDVLAMGYENPHSAQIHDMDLLGRVYRTYHLNEGCHHDACEMESGGNMLFASSSLDDQCEDRILELDRITGKKVSKLDTCEIVESKYHDQKDWSHVNTVQYLEKEGCVLLCMRNLHSIAKVDWKTKKLLWVMGDPRFWEGTEVMEHLLRPVGDVKFHFQSHTARVLEDDLDGNPDTYHVIIFDNHWHKRRSVPFFDDDPDSFVNIYTINEKNMTVELFKQYRCPKSKIRSNGILELSRNRVFAMEGNLEPAIDGYVGMIEEFDYESGKLLNEYMIRKGFYRAWEGVVDYAQLSTPMPVDSNYFVSELYPLQTVPVSDELISEELPKTSRVMGLKYKRSEDMLMIYAKDHRIRNVYLVSKEHAYRRDFSKTKQGKDVFAQRSYYILVPLDGIETGDYQVVLDYEGKLYQTGKEFSVSMV